MADDKGTTQPPAATSDLANSFKTENVFFYDVKSDGLTLDDRRTQIGDGKGDLPDVLTKFQQWSDEAIVLADRTAQAFEISCDEIRGNSYDLSLGRYKQAITVEINHENPRNLLERLIELEHQILNEATALKELL